MRGAAIAQLSPGVRKPTNQPTNKRVRVILYKRVFRFHAKNGDRKTGSCRKTRACFSFARNRNELRKNRVSLDPCRFLPLREKKTGTQKTGRSFQRCPLRRRYLFVASRRAGPTRTKILKRDNTTTNSRFMIDLVAEMLFEKTAWCFCAARMACKEWPLIVCLTYVFHVLIACLRLCLNSYVMIMP